MPIVINRVDAARDAQDTSDAVRLATQVGTALQELQEERLLSVGYLFGLVQQPELVVQSAKATDARGRRLNADDQPLSAGAAARASTTPSRLEQHPAERAQPRRSGPT